MIVQLVQQRKQEEEEEKRRKESYALQRAERAKVKQASLNKLQESWTIQAHTAISKPTGGKRGRGRAQAIEQAPEYESDGSGDDAGAQSNNEDDNAGLADRYGEGTGSPEPRPDEPSRQANLKDIGLSSSDDSDDDAFGAVDGQQENDGGQKRKWESDDETPVEENAKRQTVEDSD